MTKLLAATFGGFIFFGTIFGLAIATGNAPVASGQTVPALSTVLVEVPHALGSGVYIGNHRILTAAHVVAEDDGKSAKKDGLPQKRRRVELQIAQDVTITSEGGVTGPARVEMIDKDHDIAILTTSVDMPASELACRKPVLREPLEIIGNPLGFRFVHTYGQVSRTKRLEVGADTELDSPKDFFMAQVMIAPGNSGGPVFDQAGKVLGLVDAMMAIPVGFASVSLAPMAFIVPSLTICGQINPHVKGDKE